MARATANIVRRRARGWAAASFALALLTAALLPAGTRAMDELQFFRIGTASTTGTYFQIGGVLASAISKPPGSRDCQHGGSCGVPGLVAVAQATQGSIQNVLAVGSGQLESALAQSDVTYWAYSGEFPAPRRCLSGQGGTAAANSGLALLKAHSPMTSLRAIAGLYPENIHVVVRADGPIHTLQDLRGKRVALGEPESGTLADARVILDAAGLGDCDIKGEYLRLSQAAEALVQGDIDAFFLVGGYPVPAITDVATAVPTRLVPISADIAERLSRKYPFFGIDVIPSGTYPGMDEEVPTLSVTALWIVGAEVPDDLVYAITKALWHDTTKRLLEAAHPVGKRIHLVAALDGLVIPLHHGAARYYTETGLGLLDPP